MNRKSIKHDRAGKKLGFINNSIFRVRSRKIRELLFNEQFMRPDTLIFTKVGMDMNYDISFAEMERNDRKRIAIILLSCLICDRAAKNMMLDGKEKRFDLIAKTESN